MKSENYFNYGFVKTLTQSLKYVGSTYIAIFPRLKYLHFQVGHT